MACRVPVQQVASCTPLARPAPRVHQPRSCWSPAWTAAQDAAISHMPAAGNAASRCRRPQQRSTAAGHADAPLAQRPQRLSVGDDSTSSSGGDSSSCASRSPRLHHQQRLEQQNVQPRSRPRHGLRDRTNAADRAGADSSAQSSMVSDSSSGGASSVAAKAAKSPGSDAAVPCQGIIHSVLLSPAQHDHLQLVHWPGAQLHLDRELNPC